MDYNPKGLTTEEHQLIVLYNQDWLLKDIANEMGCSPQHISKVLKQLKKRVKPNCKRYELLRWARSKGYLESDVVIQVYNAGLKLERLPERKNDRRKTFRDKPHKRKRRAD